MIHTYCKNVPFSRKLRALPIGLGAFSDLGLLRFCLVLQAAKGFLAGLPEGSKGVLHRAGALGFGLSNSDSEGFTVGFLMLTLELCE